jgi:hypothetical protein
MKYTRWVAWQLLCSRNRLDMLEPTPPWFKGCPADCSRVHVNQLKLALVTLGRDQSRLVLEALANHLCHLILLVRPSFDGIFPSGSSVHRPWYGINIAPLRRDKGMFASALGH